MNIQAMTTKALMKVKAHSPEILITVGIVGAIGATVMACKATLKVEQIMDDREFRLRDVDEASETYSEDTYSEEDAKKDVMLINVQTGVELVKLYLPAVIVGVVSIGCIIGSHHILNTRNSALLTAYNVAQQSFESYRKEVVKRHGEDEDKDILYKTNVDILAEQEAPFETTGEQQKVKRNIGRFTRFFDESSREYQRNADYNKAFLLAQQNSANNQLKAYGMLFLNDVYKMLGFDPTPEGGVLGWVYTKENEQTVDFGIYDGTFSSRNFVNGNDPVVLLDFNVQGVVFDML